MTSKRRKPAALRRDDEIRIRLTVTEKATWTKAARLDGLTLSSWLRMLATRAVQRPNK